MMHLITRERFGEFVDELREMHRLRFRVFKERLDWEVQISGDMEIDAFDALPPAYLVQTGDDGRIQGSVRLLPTTGPTMLRDTFPILLGPWPAPSDPTIWESSRFSLDVRSDTPKGPRGLARATFELFAGMIEFGLSRDLRRIVTVTDVRMERILRRAGWPLQRIDDPRALGNTLAVAGYLDISVEILHGMRASGGFRSPVLWEPVLLPAVA